MVSCSEDHWDVVVVGAGAAGLLAASRAAERGRRTLLLEKNRKPGVKILMSGGTRCNLTHDTDAAGIIQAFGRQGRFLHSALAALGPQQLIQLIEAEGVPTKVEVGGKVFPASDRALDVQRALLRRLSRSGCQLRLAQPVQSILRSATDGHLQITTAAGSIVADRLVVATGGCSYPGCGTCGDAYAWLSALGHTIVTPRPALVPLTSRASWVPALSGVTLPDLVVRVVPRAALAELDDPAGRLAASRRYCLDERRGSMLLTHRGVSGPAILDVSRSVTGHADPASLDLICDLCPDQTIDQLTAQLQQQSRQHGGRSLARILPDELPLRLTQTILQLHDLSPQQKAAELSKSAQRRLAGGLKSLAIPLQGSRGFALAEVTAGGVDLREVDSSSMQSKRVPGLYLAGEVLDLDGWIGGYNFQAAFSTGCLAGMNT